MCPLSVFESPSLRYSVVTLCYTLWESIPVCYKTKAKCSQKAGLIIFRDITVLPHIWVGPAGYLDNRDQTGWANLFTNNIGSSVCKQYGLFGFHIGWVHRGLLVAQFLGLSSQTARLGCTSWENGNSTMGRNFSAVHTFTCLHSFSNVHVYTH